MSYSSDVSLLNFLNTYEKNQEPITVSFRELIPTFQGPDRVTHLLHPYPAKLLTHIPYFFLANNILSRKGDKIADPFCGSGTVLLESILAGRDSLGFDANPLARLISRVKTSPIEPTRLKNSINRLKSRIPAQPSIPPPNVVNIDYWFHPHVIQQLTRLREAIDETRNVHIRDFYYASFSSCVRRVSLIDPRLSVPVKLREGQYPKGHWLREKSDSHLRKLQKIDVFDQFDFILESNVKRLNLLYQQNHVIGNAQVIGTDAKDMRFDLEGEGKKVQKESIDLIITSPPYLGAQKYIRSSSLSLGWLNLCGETSLSALHQASLGREHHPKSSYDQLTPTGILPADKLIEEVFHINPLRAYIASVYLNEMRMALHESYRVLKKDSFMVLVVGNNELCGKEFNTQQYLRLIAEESGFSLVLQLIDDIRSRGLMTKRNKTASLITREWILLFKK